MSGTIISFFLALILIVRLLPLSKPTNIIINVIAGVLFLAIGLSEVSEKGWRAIFIAGMGALFIIFSFVPKLTVGAPYIWTTVILAVTIAIVAGLKEFKPKKKVEKSKSGVVSPR